MTVATGVLTVSCCLAFAFAPLMRGAERPTSPVFFVASVAALLSSALCCLAWLNLMRDAERGYGAVRSSATALVLLVATAGSLFGLLFALGQLVA